MTALMLFLFLAPEPPTPLDDLAWLVEGQWESTAKLPNGQPIESRTTWDWGPGRNSLRVYSGLRRSGGPHEMRRDHRSGPRV